MRGCVDVASVLLCQLGDVLVRAGGLLVRRGSPVVRRSRLTLRSVSRARCARSVFGCVLHAVLGVYLCLSVSDKRGSPGPLSRSVG